jgi:hypothetical protein
MIGFIVVNNQRDGRYGSTLEKIQDQLIRGI